MNTHNLKLHELQTQMNALAVEEAFKLGKKITVGIRAIAQGVGVDYATMKGLIYGTIKKPSERTLGRIYAYLQKLDDWVLDGSDDPVPELTIYTPAEKNAAKLKARASLKDRLEVAPVAKGTALLVTEDELAMLVGLLQAAESNIHDDCAQWEADAEHEWRHEVSTASYQALYRQEGLLKRLRKKIESQSPCQFKFDVELQSTVPVKLLTV